MGESAGNRELLPSPKESLVFGVGTGNAKFLNLTVEADLGD